MSNDIFKAKLRLANPTSRCSRATASNDSFSEEKLTHCSHTYQQLPLIPVEDFLAKYPEHADTDENALMAARIDHERIERELLEQQRQELLKRKQKLISENKRRKDDLANLDKDLEKFIDVCYASITRVTNGLLTVHDRLRNLSSSYSRRHLEKPERAGPEYDFG